MHNAFIHRRSYVTNSALFASEPHTAAPIVLSHESLWVDSQLIPNTMGSVLTEEHTVDTSNNDAYFDATGNLVHSPTRNGRPLAAVQKRVRLELTRGSYSEYTSDSVDLRRLIHRNYTTAHSIAVETLADGEMTVLAGHMWSVQHMAGLITVHAGMTPPDRLYVTAYFYCGRVGLDASITNPTTDDIVEGVSNKFFSKELLLSHINDLAADDEVTLALSVSSTDHLVEGVHNHFFTQERFDTALGTKTIDDIAASETSRLVTTETMNNLGLGLGGVTELELVPQTTPPVQTTGKLYVEREGGEDVLFFGDQPLGRAEPGQTRAPAINTTATAVDGIGHFTGSFDGQTRGVHTGDVIGNVTGFVSDLGNHPIIETKILGDGEGHWVGTVNADVVGKFEGYAKVVTGSIDNASHVTVGTYDASASLHVQAQDRQFRISHTSGESAEINCFPTGDLHISVAETAVVAIPRIECDSIKCHSSIHVADVLADQINCVGIKNNFYGITEVGRIEDVSEIVAEVGLLSAAEIGRTNTQALSCHNGMIGDASISVAAVHTLVVDTAACESLTSDTLSVANFHVEQLSFDASVFLENPNLIFNTLSASAATLDRLSIGSQTVGNLVVQAGTELDNLTASSITTPTITASSISVAELALNHLELPVLSVQDGYALTAMVSLSHTHTAIVDALSAASTATTELRAESLHVQSISTGSFLGLDIVTRDLSAAGVTINSLHAIALEANTALATTLSVHALQADVLSCATAECRAMDAVHLSVSEATADHLGARVLSTSTAYSDTAHANKQSALSIGTLEIFANNAYLQTLSSGSLFSDSLSVSRVVANALSVQGLSTDTHTTHMLSVNALHARRVENTALSVANLTADTARVHALSCSSGIVADNASLSHLSALSLASTSLSVARSYAHTLQSELTQIALLSVSNARLQHGTAATLSCSALKCDDIHAPRARIDVLSVHSLVGVDLASGTSGGGVSEEFVQNIFLSVNALISALSVSATVPNSLSCQLVLADELSSSTLATPIATINTLASEHARIASLSVGTLHGLVLTQELSVTGVASHLSASSLTSSDLSCATIFVDNIVRSLPHASDVANPAVLTTSTTGDFALFEEETKHSGDMIVEGSLYVTDTIFMGTQPALRIENVQHIVASSISVGELAVGMLTGIGEGTLGSVVSNLLSVSPHDTVHEGNMLVDGNLVVSGVVLTGAHNKLLSETGSFEMAGSLSISGDVITGDVNLTQRLDDIENAILSGSALSVSTSLDTSIIDEMRARMDQVENKTYDSDILAPETKASELADISIMAQAADGSIQLLTPFAFDQTTELSAVARVSALETLLSSVSQRQMLLYDADENVVHFTTPQLPALDTSLPLQTRVQNVNSVVSALNNLKTFRLTADGSAIRLLPV